MNKKNNTAEIQNQTNGFDVEKIRKDLKNIGQTLVVRIGSAKDIFEDLSHQYNIKSISSHEETGNKWTYDRDNEIQNWCHKNNILFNEFPSNGIVKRLKNRIDWSKIRNLRMKEELISTPTKLSPILKIEEGKIEIIKLSLINKTNPTTT